MEQVLSVNEREKLRLREDNKNIENDTRRLSEQVSEEVENVRNESRAIEAALQDSVRLKDELTKTEEAKAKYQRSTTSLKQATTALYIEVITLKAQLEILAVDNLKAIEKNNHLQSLYDEAVSASRGLESEVENTLLIQNQEQHEKNIKADSDLFHICSATSITEVKVCVEDEQDTGK